MAQLQSDIQTTLDALYHANKQLTAIRASSSWRVTAPLRWLGRIFKRLQSSDLCDKTSHSYSSSVNNMVMPLAALESVSEKLAIMAKGKTRIAYFAENIHSSTFRYRAANMVQVLNQSESQMSVETSAACFFEDDLTYAANIAEAADILVISRARYSPEIGEFIQLFKNQNKKVWFDIDDWVFDSAAIDLIIQTSGQVNNDESLNYWHAVVSRMGKTLQMCDAAITTNKYLAEKIKAFTARPVCIVPNFANEAQEEVSKPAYLKKIALKADQQVAIKLGYFSGSHSHDKDFELIVPALSAAMRKDNRLVLVVVGPLTVAVEFEAEFGSRIIRHGFTDFLTLQSLISEVDFNLVPLLSNEFTNCKSELKYVDAALVGTLTIASPTHAYAAVIRHGANGYLAADDEWEAVLMQAIADRDNYEHMAKAAHEDVQQRFTWKTQKPAILEALGLNKR